MLIVVGGPPAVGKSTIIRLLLKKLTGKTIHVQTDLFRYQMLARPTFSSKESARIYEAMFGTAEVFLRGGYRVIVDATFGHPASRGAARALAKRARVPIAFFVLTASRKELLARNNQRRGIAKVPLDAISRIQRQITRYPISRAHLIDTSRLTKSETAQRIFEILKQYD